MKVNVITDPHTFYAYFRIASPMCLQFRPGWLDRPILSAVFDVWYDAQARSMFDD